MGETKRDRPKIVSGKTVKVKVGCGNAYVVINKDGDSLLEVFAKLGKAGGCPAAFLEGMTRCITLGLKYGVPVKEFCKELEGIQCPNPSWDEGEQVKSCPDAVSQILKEEAQGK